jgi:hypothetical protein
VAANTFEQLPYRFKSPLPEQRIHYPFRNLRCQIGV